MLNIYNAQPYDVAAEPIYDVNYDDLDSAEFLDFCETYNEHSRWDRQQSARSFW